MRPEFETFHDQAVERFAFEPFPMLDHSARRGLPYEFCKRERVERLALLDGTSVEHYVSSVISILEPHDRTILVIYDLM